MKHRQRHVSAIKIRHGRAISIRCKSRVYSWPRPFIPVMHTRLLTRGRDRDRIFCWGWNRHPDRSHRYFPLVRSATMWTPWHVHHLQLSYRPRILVWFFTGFSVLTIREQHLLNWLQRSNEAKLQCHTFDKLSMQVQHKLKWLSSKITMVTVVALAWQNHINLWSQLTAFIYFPRSQLMSSYRVSSKGRSF